MEVPECDEGKILVVVDAGKILLAVAGLAGSGRLVGWASFLVFRVFLVTFIVVVLADAVTSQLVIIIAFIIIHWTL